VKKLLSLGKYVALLPLVEPILHDALTIVEDLGDGKLDEPASEAAAADLGKRLLKAVAWVRSHGLSALVPSSGS
jgi:hypothetical protein